MFLRFIDFVNESKKVIKMPDTNIFYIGVENNYLVGYIGEPYNKFKISLKDLLDVDDMFKSFDFTKLKDYQKDIFYDAVTNHLLSLPNYKKNIQTDFDDSVKLNLEDIEFLIKYYNTYQNNSTVLGDDYLEKFETDIAFKEEYKRVLDLYIDYLDLIEKASEKAELENDIDKGVEFLKDNDVLFN